ncbi:MAG: hypothetical protein K9K39_04865 [Desulfohalobiaceae bacterium]|nr:hypothetical protein [Desulfohalobiaceae bacterium]
MPATPTLLPHSRTHTTALGAIHHAWPHASSLVAWPHHAGSHSTSLVASHHSGSHSASLVAGPHSWTATVHHSLPLAVLLTAPGTEPSLALRALTLKISLLLGQSGTSVYQ